MTSYPADLWGQLSPQFVMNDDDNDAGHHIRVKCLTAFCLKIRNKLTFAGADFHPMTDTEVLKPSASSFPGID